MRITTEIMRGLQKYITNPAYSALDVTIIERRWTLCGLQYCILFVWGKLILYHIVKRRWVWLFECNYL